jgi:hypothetical protein
MVGVHKNDLAYLLAHVADEIHGHPDHIHWLLPLLQRAIGRMNYALGEDKLASLERQVPLQLQSPETSDTGNANRTSGLLHGGEPRLSPDEIRYSFEAKRTPAAVRIENLRDEMAAWLTLRGYTVDTATTYLDSGAVGNLSVQHRRDTTIFSIDVRGGYLYMHKDDE